MPEDRISAQIDVSRTSICRSTSRFYRRRAPAFDSAVLPKILLLSIHAAQTRQIRD